jgi:hypothetical protein
MNFDQIFSDIFGKFGKYFTNRLSIIIPAMMRCSSCNLSTITTNLAYFAKQNFKANENRVYRFFASKNFSINDSLWRCYLNLIFKLLSEQKYIKKDKLIQINIDFTSTKDNFLILYAAIPFFGRSVPIYFTIRRYPKRKNQNSQIKMELAFIKGLKHVLSDKYSYLIVADRGFGNQRFTKLCLDNGFNYLIRIKGNLLTKFTDEKGFKIDKLENLQTNKNGCKKFKDLFINSWDRKETIFIISKEEDLDNKWYICTSLENITTRRAQIMYEDRFSIEKTFYDHKSGGFDLESSKIDKYERFKRLLFCTSLSISLMVITGRFIKKKNKYLQVFFPYTQGITTVYSP